MKKKTAKVAMKETPTSTRKNNNNGHNNGKLNSATSLLTIFSARSGIVVDIGIDPKADDFFTLMFDEGLFDKIVGETNRYACQKLADNEQRLGRWRNVSKPEVKDYFGMCTIMAMNILPTLADYWSSDIFMGNEGIKKSHAEEPIRRNQPIFSFQ